MTSFTTMLSSVSIGALNWFACPTGLPTRTKANKFGVNSQKQVNGSRNTNRLLLKTKFGYHSVDFLKDNQLKQINSTPLISLSTLMDKYFPNTERCIYLFQTSPKKVAPLVTRIRFNSKETILPDHVLALLDTSGYQ